MSKLIFKAVTNAYRRSKQNGAPDHFAFLAALNVYSETYPNVSKEKARENVGKVIAEATKVAAGAT